MEETIKQHFNWKTRNLSCFTLTQQVCFDSVITAPSTHKLLLFFRQMSWEKIKKIIISLSVSTRWHIYFEFLKREWVFRTKIIYLHWLEFLISIIISAARDFFVRLYNGGFVIDTLNTSFKIVKKWQKMTWKSKLLLTGRS